MTSESTRWYHRRWLLASIILVLGTVAIHYVTRAPWLASVILTTFILLAGMATPWLTSRIASRR